MLIPLQQILSKYGLKPKGVVHVGAHWAEEHDEYVRCGIKAFTYIEPCKDAFDILYWKFNGGNEDIKLFNVGCGKDHATMPMYVSHNNQGQSNSLLEPHLHLQQHPEVVFNDAEVIKVVPLDSLQIIKYEHDMLVMDVQGYEGEVLKGATETLRHIDIVYTEVNRGETYKGNALIEELDKMLWEFKRVETYWPSPSWTWGDAIYVRQS